MCRTGDQSLQRSATQQCSVLTRFCKFGCTTLWPVSSSLLWSCSYNNGGSTACCCRCMPAAAGRCLQGARCTIWGAFTAPAEPFGSTMSADWRPAADCFYGCLQGWLHHLARHAVACFLTRGDLYVSWERGRDTFDRLLIDDDYFINNGETRMGCPPSCNERH